jgi:hypothetical protein
MGRWVEKGATGDCLQASCKPAKPNKILSNLAPARQGRLASTGACAKGENGSLRHIDIWADRARIAPTETSGCTPGMRFSLKICARNFAFDIGDNLSTFTRISPAFIAANNPNPSTMFCRAAEVA